MPNDKTPVNALLATACSRMLNAAFTLNQMRELIRQDRETEYWQQANVLAEHLTVGGHAITEAHRILLADCPVLCSDGRGLVH